MNEKCFAESVRTILRERGMSQRELARVTQRHHGWGNSTTVSRMLANDLPPTLEGMEKIARALHVSPAIWPEYRMARWRHDLNPVRVGLDDAYATLREVERVQG